MRDPQILGALVRIEPLRPTLRGHVLRPAKGSYADFTHLLLIGFGAATLNRGEAGHVLTGPAAAVIPPQPAAEVDLAAGSTGWPIGAAPLLMAEAVGNRAELVLLQPLIDWLVIAQGDRDRFAVDFLFPAEQVHREVTQPTRSSQLAVVAYLRLMLIALSRGGSFEVGVTPGRSTELHVLQGFRRLVELNFGKQTSLASYAAQLGVSYDRLHDLCSSALQRSPLQLVHQRLVREAAIHLERSGESITDISNALGLSDPTRFSHFFKRQTQLSPAAFRRRSRLLADQPGQGPISFSDWP